VCPIFRRKVLRSADDAPALLDRDLSPAVIIFVNSHSFAAFDALKEPNCNDFGGRILESLHFIEKPVIKFLDERHNHGIDLGKILNKSAGIERPSHNDVHTVVVPMQIFALVAVREERKVMS
jgi:hypothetical protein